LLSIVVNPLHFPFPFRNESLLLYRNFAPFFVFQGDLRSILLDFLPWEIIFSPFFGVTPNFHCKSFDLFALKNFCLCLYQMFRGKNRLQGNFPLTETCIVDRHRYILFGIQFSLLTLLPFLIFFFFFFVFRSQNKTKQNNNPRANQRCVYA